MRTAKCTQQNVYCKMHTAKRILQNAHYKMCTAKDKLSVTAEHCKTHDAHYAVCISYCIKQRALFTFNFVRCTDIMHRKTLGSL